MMPPYKSDIARVLAAYTTLCRKYGVKIRLNTEADKKSILKLDPDVLFLISVVQSWDVLLGKVAADEHPLIIGGGLVGLETAEYLISQLRPTDIVEMKEECSWGSFEGDRLHLQSNLKNHDVTCYTGHKVKKFVLDGAVCENENGEVTLSGYDQIISALGANLTIHWLKILATLIFKFMSSEMQVKRVELSDMVSMMPHGL